jgi:hypothetical protein
MEAGRARPETCLTCHAHRATAHLTDAACASCHVNLPRAAGLTAEAIAALPRPPSHDSDYVLAHKQDAERRAQNGGGSCQVCHTRESCAACHVNASRVPAIVALERDPRGAQLATARPVVYPEPPSHGTADFTRAHGGLMAANPASCASCHSRESCLTCHRTEERVGLVAGMPRRVRGGAPGVDLTGLRPPGHLPNFATQHQAAAASGEATCASCHTPRYCSTCHMGAAAPAFHGENFVQRHASSAYAPEQECATCHQTTSFCMSCHNQAGLSTAQAIPPQGAFHTTANWIFGHSAAARRSLETCASCHQQRFCLSCHSSGQGWGVKPHGPEFDPDRARRQNPAVCAMCHRT